MSRCTLYRSLHVCTYHCTLLLPRATVWPAHALSAAVTSQHARARMSMHVMYLRSCECRNRPDPPPKWLPRVRTLCTLVFARVHMTLFLFLCRAYPERTSPAPATRFCGEYRCQVEGDRSGAPVQQERAGRYSGDGRKHDTHCLLH